MNIQIQLSLHFYKSLLKDFYSHYIYLIEEGNKLKTDTTYYKSFISNSLILKITELKKEDYKFYKRKLKEEKVFDNILNDTFSRKVKKVLLKLSPKLYYKIMKG